MDAAQWSQEIGVENNTCNNSQMLKRKVKPQEQLNCPRCNSTNTKFCYYNNYSLTQPRYFCKTCRRYWTEGGSLRNVPVGGGSGKNKRHVSSAKIPDLNPPTSISQFSSQLPKTLQGQDLNLAFHIGKTETNVSSQQNYSSSSPSFLRTGTSTSSRGMNLNSYTPIQMPIMLENSNTMFSSGFPTMQEFKPTLNFSLDFLGSRYNEAQENGGRLFFPSAEFKQLSNGTEMDQNKGQGTPSTGYWSGMLGGGSW